MCEPVSVVYHSTVPPAHQQLSTTHTHIATSTTSVHNYLSQLASYQLKVVQ